MNLNEVITLLQLQGGATLVSVQFDGDRGEYEDRVPHGRGAGPRTYTYKNLTVPGLAIDDLVVVQSGPTLAIGRVVGLIPVTAMGSLPYDKLRHVVSRVDRQAFDAVLAGEDRAREALAMAEINERLAAVQRTVPQGALFQAQNVLGLMAPAVPVPAAPLGEVFGEAAPVQPWAPAQGV